MNNYLNVTEIPGLKASSEQLSMIITRYNLAKKYLNGEKVLELACGSGSGLSYLINKKQEIIGIDIDPELITIAKNNNFNFPNVTVKQCDAEKLYLEDHCIDTVIFFEAIYYIKNTFSLFNEINRVTKSDGLLIISSVNPQWHGFNPSPNSTRYFKIDELIDELKKYNFISQSVLLGFYNPKNSNIILNHLKILAVKLKLIPKTMNGKKILKRIFFGKLKSIPTLISDDMAQLSELKEYDKIHKSEISNYKQFYLILKKSHE
jgi:ubiquinone/menaquinone biosynthesis C-methylase UbiE